MTRLPRGLKRGHPLFTALLGPRPKNKIIRHVKDLDGEAKVRVEINIVHLLDPLHGYLVEGLEVGLVLVGGIADLTLDPECGFFSRAAGLDERCEDIFPYEFEAGVALLFDPSVGD